MLAALTLKTTASSLSSTIVHTMCLEKIIVYLQYSRIKENSTQLNILINFSLRSQHCMQIFRVPFIDKTSENMKNVFNFPHSFQIILSLRKTKYFFLMNKALYFDDMTRA